ncbi:MAG: hypothetical protein A3K19_08550 [Lentisphaerae bacterium RIFOXYB12_FULL_65_16]|nr:MAG: hypothetical protein A3K18_27590 [Lentisphaerae bacterium RIFOXYA12_64_32]OGV87658.1 MAG: hypothetical protein A3K19_08550 [Lentisphaerae bacterium RIFOXYB12_FULL_65_16]
MNIENQIRDKVIDLFTHIALAKARQQLAEREETMQALRAELQTLQQERAHLMGPPSQRRPPPP